MLGYLVLSLSCLLLLMACGDGLTGQAWGKEPRPAKSADKVQDASGNGISKENIGKDVGGFNPPKWKPMVCKDCDLVNADLKGANLAGAYLPGADLPGATLNWADLTRANLDGVIGANFSGALTVPSKYLKD